MSDIRYSFHFFIAVFIMQTHQGLLVFIGSRASPKEKQMAMNYATVSLIMGSIKLFTLQIIKHSNLLEVFEEIVFHGFLANFYCWQKELKNNKFHAIEHNAISAGTIGIKPRRLW